MQAAMFFACIVGGEVVDKRWQIKKQVAPKEKGGNYALNKPLLSSGEESAFAKKSVFSPLRWRGKTHPGFGKLEERKTEILFLTGSVQSGDVT